MFGDYPPLQRHGGGALFDRTVYGRPLIDEPHRSHTSRYAQLIEDVRDDITRFEPFFLGRDGDGYGPQAQRSLKLVWDLSPREQTTRWRAWKETC